MNTKSKIITTIAALALIIVLAIVSISSLLPSTKTALGSVEFNPLYKVTTLTSVTVPTATSTQLMATTTGRQYFAISNGSTVGAYISFGTTATTTRGIYIAPGAIYDMDSNGIYTGLVTAISASSGSAVLSITEF